MNKRINTFVRSDGFLGSRGSISSLVIRLGSKAKSGDFGTASCPACTVCTNMRSFHAPSSIAGRVLVSAMTAASAASECCSESYAFLRFGFFIQRSGCATRSPCHGHVHRHEDRHGLWDHLCHRLSWVLRVLLTSPQPHCEACSWVWERRPRASCPMVGNREG